jgi:hypothetical protein
VSILHVLNLYTADNFSKDVDNYEARSAPTQSTTYTSFGTAGLGLDTTKEAWATLTQVFYSESKPFDQICPGHPSTTFVGHMDRLSVSFLNTSPVDILLLGDLDTRRDTDWLQRVIHAQRPPRLVLEFWNEEALLSEAGPVSKKLVTEWQAAGYGSTCSLLNATQVGGVVDRTWLLVARHTCKNLRWPEWHRKVVRPMQNCLRPTGIPWVAYIRPENNHRPQSQINLPSPRTEWESMPHIPGSLIETSSGVRRILNDEIARGLGVPKTWLGEVYPSGQLVRRRVALHDLRGSRSSSHIRTGRVWSRPPPHSMKP